MATNKNKPLFTVGMAVYDDFPGVYMTIQALRMYQDTTDCEIIVVDNRPGTADGKACQNLVEGFAKPQFVQGKYIQNNQIVGTTAPRQMVFDHAEGEYVICMDSHIMLIPGALKALKDYYRKNPDNNSILTGPLFNDHLYLIGTHFNYVWRAEMWGRWGQVYACKECGFHFSCNDELHDQKVHYIDLMGQVSVSPYQAPYIDQCPSCGHIFPKELPWAGHERELINRGYRPQAMVSRDPFEIPAMGLGLFACKKEHWHGWGYDHRGFGGEECCIHDIHRKEKNGSTLCLPTFGWIHRFAHKKPEYPLNAWNKVRNYVLWFKRLGYELGPVYSHFVDEHHIIEKHAVDFIAGNPEKRIWPLGGKHLVDPDTPEGQKILAQLAKQPADLQQHISPKGEQFSPSNTYKEQLAQVQKEQAVAEQTKEGCGGCSSKGYHIQPDTSRSWTAIELYDWLRSQPRDFNEHMDVLKDFCSRCDRITDLGHRRESIIAMMMSKAEVVDAYNVEANDPLTKMFQEFLSKGELAIDVYHHHTLQEIQSAHLVQLEIQPTDLLFIDTTMTFDRILRILETYAPKVYKYIAIHDTQLFAHKGEDGGPGILGAVRVWLRKNPEWFPCYITDKQYGFTVYSRVVEDRPKLPHFAQKVFNFAMHAAQHVKEGVPATPDNIMESRLNICANCSMRNLDTCSACGCPLPKKTAWADQYCDHGRWGPYRNETDTGIPS